MKNQHRVNVRVPDEIYNNIQEICGEEGTKQNPRGLPRNSLLAICGVGVRFVRELEQGKDSCHIGKAMIVIAMLGLSLTIDGSDAI